MSRIETDSQFQAPFYRRLLKRSLDARVASNSEYSLRAFARDLKVSPALLTLVLQGKRGLSPQKAQHIVQRLGLESSLAHRFVEEVKSLHSRHSSARASAGIRLNELKQNDETLNLSLDAFSIISEWYHLAILQTLKLTTASLALKQQVEWLGKSLGIESQVVLEALTRLERLDLIERASPKMGYTVCKDTVFSGDGVPSSAIRNFHRQILQKALRSIDEQAIGERVLRSSVTAIRSQDLPLIQKDIFEFHKRMLAKYGESNDEADSVYAFSSQFFKITSGEKNEKS